MNRDASGALISLDAHPHLREYFAKQLRTQMPKTWRSAHRRLYDHLCSVASERTRVGLPKELVQQLGWNTPDDGGEPTIEDLQPLYHAIGHGCESGLQRQAFKEVYRQRINRWNEHFSVRKLGAFGSDLGAVACFFDIPWEVPSRALTKRDQALLLMCGSFALHALGRLVESLEPMQAGLNLNVARKDWVNAAISAGTLSELCLTMGGIAEATENAKLAVAFADRSGDAFLRMANRTALADALQQAGHRADAETRFGEAEQMQIRRQPDYPMLYSLAGFRYCDLLLSAQDSAAGDLNAAVVGFRRANRSDFLPRALLTRAWLRLLTGAGTGPESAQEDLDEALEIAERGPMRLHMADIHLYRARLFFREAHYPWESPAADLAAAEKLINQCGYHRRDEELADAKRAILGS